MRKVIELVKYQLQIYFKGSKFIMPLILTVIFLYTMYSVKPTGIVDSFAMSGYLVFFIMVWTGLGVSSSEDPVMEQIQLLRVEKRAYYELSKPIFLILIGLLLTAICTVFPVVQNILNHKELFLRDLTGYDILNGSVLLFGCTFVGGAVGSLFHPRVLKDRKMAVILTVFLSILSAVGTAIVQEIPALKVILWMIPPIGRISAVYARTDIFDLGKTGMICLLFAAYGIGYSVIKTVLCRKRKF